MQAFLLRLWALPLPWSLRRLASWLVTRPWLLRWFVPRYFVGVSCLVQNREGEILLVRHSYRLGTPWGMPSGFLERGEQPAAAIARELCEETGLEVELDPIWRVHSDERRPLVTLVFPGRVRAGEFRPSAEVTDAAFFPLHDLPPMIPDQIRLIQAWMEESSAPTTRVGSELL